ncbi:hypothetical protein ACX8XN_03190 [Calditrichota bacterium GD2]
MSNEIGWFLVAALLKDFEPGLKGLQDCLDFNSFRKAQVGFKNSKHEIRNSPKGAGLNKFKSPNFQMFKTPQHHSVLNFCHSNLEIV